VPPTAKVLSYEGRAKEQKSEFVIRVDGARSDLVGGMQSPGHPVTALPDTMQGAHRALRTSNMILAVSGPAFYHQGTHDGTFRELGTFCSAIGLVCRLGTEIIE